MDDPLWRLSLAVALLAALPSLALAQSDRPPGSSYLELAQNNVSDDQAPGRTNDAEVAVTTSPQARQGVAGLAVDSGGNPAVDPTANVIALTRAEARRQDDLREASERFILAKIEAAGELESMRQDNSRLLRELETRRIDDLINLRAQLEGQLAQKESERIDAIRTVDANAVQNATESAADRASVLAQNVDSSAEALRSLVASTEASVAAAAEQSNNALTTALERSTSALSARIAALEQAQYVGQGQQTVRDPAFLELQTMVRDLITSRATTAGQAAERDPAIDELRDIVTTLVKQQNTTAGQGQGSSMTITYVVMAAGFLLTILTIVGAVIAISRASSASRESRIVARPVHSSDRVEAAV